MAQALCWLLGRRVREYFQGWWHLKWHWKTEEEFAGQKGRKGTAGREDGFYKCIVKENGQFKEWKKTSTPRGKEANRSSMQDKT